MRQIVLDTETTGLEPDEGHRIIEIGCVEVSNRRITENRYHQYINPDREVDVGALDVHGITNEFLSDKPRFGEIVDDFLAFIKGAELIIHNAPFDVGFIDHELTLFNASSPLVDQLCTVTDTLVVARKMYPGQRNSLDALCKRFEIDNSQRTLHGALLDAEILADVYLAMTGGQASFELEKKSSTAQQRADQGNEVAIPKQSYQLKVQQATDSELELHNKVLDMLRKGNEGRCAWD